MELWYTDKHTEDVNFSIKVKRQLVHQISEIQQIDILDTYGFGRVLVLDGDLMITEKDEYIYHEMMTHVPMAVHPHVETVLVVGGGDGGTVRELVKYSSIKDIDLVLDERARELYGEGHRWMDLRRTKQLVRYNVQFSEYIADENAMKGNDGNIRWYRPIPTNEISANTGISVADQNPGY